MNQTGETITRLRVSYVGEQYRLGSAGRADRLQFQFSVDATSLSSGLWRGVAALDFLSPSTAQVGRINPPATRSISAEIAGANIPPGAAFFMRWLDTDATGADDGLAIDEPISRIQGNGELSPLTGRVVSTRGIVTARKFNGLFVQTPDGEDDHDPSTSDAVFVFTGSTPPADARPGSMVELTGTVDEFRPSTDPGSPPLTEIKELEELAVVSSDNPLPEPMPIDQAALSPWGAANQLERFEAMRVRVDSLTVVGPTEDRVQQVTASSISTGVFQGVLLGTPRPYREPGIETTNLHPNSAACRSSTPTRSASGWLRTSWKWPSACASRAWSVRLISGTAPTPSTPSPDRPHSPDRSPPPCLFRLPLRTNSRWEPSTWNASTMTATIRAATRSSRHPPTNGD